MGESGLIKIMQGTGMILLGRHTQVVLRLPRGVIGGRKCRGEVDFGRDFNVTSRTGVEPEPCVSRSAAGDDEHQCPVAAAKDASECFLIGSARVRATAGVGVNPDPGELVRTQTVVNLFVEEIGDGLIQKGHVHGIALLLYEPDVGDQARIGRVRHAEATDFRRTGIT